MADAVIDVIKLLQEIASANQDLKADVKNTASKLSKQMIGAGVGGAVGALVGGAVAGPVGGVVGGAVGAGVGATFTARKYKSLLELLKDANEEDRRQIIQVTQTVALRLSIGLTTDLLLKSKITGLARTLLIEVFKELGFIVD